MVPGLDEIERLNSLLETLRRHGVASFQSGDLRIELGFSPVEAEETSLAAETERMRQRIQTDPLWDAAGGPPPAVLADAGIPPPPAEEEEDVSP